MFQAYVLGLLDVLGQREDLERLKKSLSAAPSSRHLTEEEDKPRRKVLRVRDFLGQYHVMMKEQNTAPNATIQQFGDTIILCSPIEDDNSIPLLLPVYVTLLTFAKAMLTCLSLDIPARGAIEFGYATALGEGDIYGPVVADAYNLERRIAQYPRVVIGPDLRAYLFGAEDDEKVQCRRFIGKDKDGEAFLDFLGLHMSKKLRDEKPLPGMTGREVVTKGFQFVCREHEKFANDGNKQKLALRYALLKDYYLSRMHLWNLDSSGQPM